EDADQRIDEEDEEEEPDQPHAQRAPEHGPRGPGLTHGWRRARRRRRSGGRARSTPHATRAGAWAGGPRAAAWLAGGEATAASRRKSKSSPTPKARQSMGRGAPGARMVGGGQGDGGDQEEEPDQPHAQRAPEHGPRGPGLTHGWRRARRRRRSGGRARS